MGMSSYWRPASGTVMCNVYPDHPPILSMWDSDGVGVSMSRAGRQMTAEHLSFARSLAKQTAEYARECERWVVDSEKQEAPETACAV